MANPSPPYVITCRTTNGIQLPKLFSSSSPAPKKFITVLWYFLNKFTTWYTTFRLHCTGIWSMHSFIQLYYSTCVCQGVYQAKCTQAQQTGFSLHTSHNTCVHTHVSRCVVGMYVCMYVYVCACVCTYFFFLSITANLTEKLQERKLIHTLASMYSSLVAVLQNTISIPTPTNSLIKWRKLNSCIFLRQPLMQNVPTKVLYDRYM